MHTTLIPEWNKPLKHSVLTKPSEGELKMSLVMDLLPEDSARMSAELANLPSDQWEKGVVLTQGNSPLQFENFPTDYKANPLAGGPGVPRTGGKARGVPATGKAARGVPKTGGKAKKTDEEKRLVSLRMHLWAQTK